MYACIHRSSSVCSHPGVWLNHNLQPMGPPQTCLNPPPGPGGGLLGHLGGGPGASLPPRTGSGGGGGGVEALLLPNSEWHAVVLHSLVPHFREFSVGSGGRVWVGALGAFLRVLSVALTCVDAFCWARDQCPFPFLRLSSPTRSTRATNYPTNMQVGPLPSGAVQPSQVARAHRALHPAAHALSARRHRRVGHRHVPGRRSMGGSSRSPCSQGRPGRRLQPAAARGHSVGPGRWPLLSRTGTAPPPCSDVQQRTRPRRWWRAHAFCKPHSAVPASPRVCTAQSRTVAQHHSKCILSCVDCVLAHAAVAPSSAHQPSGRAHPPPSITAHPNRAGSAPQGPPGTGKTSAIMGIVSVLLAKKEIQRYQQLMAAGRIVPPPASTDADAAAAAPLARAGSGGGALLQRSGSGGGGKAAAGAAAPAGAAAVGRGAIAAVTAAAVAAVGGGELRSAAAAAAAAAAGTGALKKSSAARRFEAAKAAAAAAGAGGGGNATNPNGRDPFAPPPAKQQRTSGPAPADKPPPATAAAAAAAAAKPSEPPATSTAADAASPDAALAEAVRASLESYSLTSPPPCRVLVCAQSNAAIDELLTRMAVEGVWRADGRRRPPAVVRLGRVEVSLSAARMRRVFRYLAALAGLGYTVQLIWGTGCGSYAARLVVWR